MRYSFILTLATFSLFAQSDRPGSISIGAKIGAPINTPGPAFPFATSNQEGRWTGGPTVEVQLPFRFSIEFDALYRTAQSRSSYSFPLGSTSNPYNVSLYRESQVWDLPLMLKYHFHVGALRPFLSAGAQFTHESIDAQSAYTCSGPTGSCLPANYPNPVPTGGNFSTTRNTIGPVAGAGVEFRTRYLAITPELRYNNFRPANSPRESRFTALVGFTFGVRK